MLRLYTDFNARTPAGACWNLVHEGAGVSGDLVKVGDHVVLFQDDDDFEVEATIDFRFVDVLNRDGWVATPLWSTKRSVRRVRQVSGA